MLIYPNIDKNRKVIYNQNMKIDYNRLMHEEISNLGEKPRLLLHCCCAPCSSAVIERIKDHFDITYFYFNPNIYPQEDYDKRYEEFSKLGVKVVALNYDHDEFLSIVNSSISELRLR